MNSHFIQFTILCIDWMIFLVWLAILISTGLFHVSIVNLQVTRWQDDPSLFTALVVGWLLTGFSSLPDGLSSASGLAQAYPHGSLKVSSTRREDVPVLSNALFTWSHLLIIYYPKQVLWPNIVKGQIYRLHLLKNYFVICFAKIQMQGGGEVLII